MKMMYNIYGERIGCKEKKKTIACIDIKDTQKREAFGAMMKKHSYKGKNYIGY